MLRLGFTPEIIEKRHGVYPNFKFLKLSSDVFDLRYNFRGPDSTNFYLIFQGNPKYEQEHSINFNEFVNNFWKNGKRLKLHRFFIGSEYKQCNQLEEP